MRMNLARDVDLIGMAVLERTSDILFIDGTVEFENSSPLCYSAITIMGTEGIAQ
jgi:hypothetical protein